MTEPPLQQGRRPDSPRKMVQLGWVATGFVFALFALNQLSAGMNFVLHRSAFNAIVHRVLQERLDPGASASYRLGRLWDADSLQRVAARRPVVVHGGGEGRIWVDKSVTGETTIVVITVDWARSLTRGLLYAESGRPPAHDPTTGQIQFNGTQCYLAAGLTRHWYVVSFPSD